MRDKLIRALRATLILIVVCFLSLSTMGQQTVDKMVATVNAGARTEMITYSDLVWQLALQPN
ncbi:MAG TPA: hypothetical protein VFH91_07970, partial [Pyrinomonadaceae bacterium]|nr:hypothetical protein [Pyrinomonadaceae bacterium]